jgi:hypothetical protein
MDFVEKSAKRGKIGLMRCHDHLLKIPMPLGNRSGGIYPIHGLMRPTTTRALPAAMSNFCMPGVFL